jgi:hypothetical protein
MQEEYVTIVEAARRIGISDKTVRRAIHDGKLTARYPHPNKAEVALTDLLSWRAMWHIRPGETQERVKALETQLSQLTARVAFLEGQFADLQAIGPQKKAPPQPEKAAPTTFTYLSEFCQLHFVPYQAAADLFPRAIRGQRIKVQGRLQPMLGPKGRHDFYVQLHTRPDFRVCDDCPHEENGQHV